MSYSDQSFIVEGNSLEQDEKKKKLQTKHITICRDSVELAVRRARVAGLNCG